MAKRKKREVVEMMLQGADRTSLVTERMKKLYEGGRTGAKEGQRETASPEEYAADTVQEEMERAPQESVHAVRQVNRTAERVWRVKEARTKRAEGKGKSLSPRERMKVRALKAAGQSGQNVVKKSKKGIAKAKEAVVASAKAVYRGMKSSAMLFGTLGGTAVLVILVICMAAIVFGYAFGIFFSGTEGGERTIRMVMRELDAEYDQQIAEMQESVKYDILEMHGARPEWREVLAIYVVKTNLDPNDPEELITMTDGKEQMLRDIYWDMCSISSKVETEKRIVITPVVDKDGNMTEKKEIKDVAVLTIQTDCARAEEIAGQYFFDRKQKELLKELLATGLFEFTK